MDGLRNVFLSQTISPRSALAPRTRRASRLGVLLAATLSVAACDSGGARLGPRIVELGQPVPKGGGVYKVGSPYRLNGRTYTPEEVKRYDETGIASWYGELFHGRRTANGEIFDMEALSAAHPTMPLPSYARVTNLRNGRSLVVRVNDRGPYAHGRMIDLSWAVASLLEMKGAGTAPVRVQYLGPAPLGGGERYERDVLAAQHWAGPRVAFAASPAKALRREASAGRSRHAARAPQESPATAALEPQMDPAPAARDTGANRPPTIPVSFVEAVTTGKIAAPARGAPSAKPQGPKPQGPKPSAAPPRPAAIPAGRTAAIPSAPKKPASAVAAPAPIFVEAGLFPRKATADRLASILGEIAATTVEPVTLGHRSVHRLRLGPFQHDRAAQAAVTRMRDAGLTDARIEKPRG